MDSKLRADVFSYRLVTRFTFTHESLPSVSVKLIAKTRSWWNQSINQSFICL